MKVKVLSDIDELNSYRDLWEDILIKNNNNIPFVEMDWILRWWRYFGSNYNPYIIVLMDGNSPAGFCPLMMEDKKLYKKIYFVGYPLTSYMDIVVPDELKKEAVSAVISHLSSLKNCVIMLHGLLEDNQSLIYLSENLNNKSLMHYNGTTEFRYIKKEDWKFNDYFKKKCDSCSLRAAKKKEKKLSKLGNVIMGQLDSARIDLIFELYHKRWKKRNPTHDFSKGNIKELFKLMAVEKDVKPKVYVNGFLINNRLIAFQYGFECGSRHLFYATAFDDDFSMYGPGKIIILDTVRRLFDSGVEIIDYGVGYERYKAECSDGIGFVKKIVFPCKGIISKIIFLKQAIVEIIIQTLKRNRRIVEFKRNILGAIKYNLSRDSIGEKCNRLKHTVNQWGMLGLLSKSIGLILGFFYGKSEFIIFKKDLNNEQVPEKKGFLIREAKIDDVNNLANIMNVSLRKVIGRFYHGNKCYIAEYDGNIVHYGWVDVSIINMPELKGKVTMEKNSGYIYDGFTLKEYRGKGLSPAVLLYTLNSLYEEGFKNCYVIVNKKNIASLKAVGKVGFKPFLNAAINKILGKVRCNITQL
jgi:Acetyltransferase (GNAT) family.